MNRDKDNSKFDFENDPQFNESFSKNIEEALNDSEVTAKQPEVGENKEKKENLSEITPLNDITAELEAENAAKEDIIENTAVNTDPSADHSEAATLEAGVKTPGKTIDVITEGNLAIKRTSETEEAEKLPQNPDALDFEEELTDINSSLASQISSVIDNQTAEMQKLKKKKRLFKIESGIILTVLCLIGFGFFFGFTKPGNSILMSMGVNIGGTIWGSMTNKFDDSTKVVEDVDYLDEEDLKSTAPTVEPSKIVWPENPGVGRHEEGVYNILLLGEEAIGMGDGRGHTDVMVIATLNTKDKTVKLTSLMRDMLVQIPGYQDNKLNVAYEKGGLDLLYETISNNFGIKLDGCAKVNFNSFEQIVDALGGLEITLKQNEADYLNTTNYISEKQYRHVVAGKQLLNGNQVLGYARVRKTSTITGHNNDYGRTDRHRIVLNAIYEKCRSMSKTQLLSLMFKFLPMITTDVSSDCFEEMLNSYMDLGMSSQKIQQLRIPADNTFQDNVRVRGMSVLIPDLNANRKILDSFIFGENITTGTDAAAITQAPDDNTISSTSIDNSTGKDSTSGTNNSNGKDSTKN